MKGRIRVMAVLALLVACGVFPAAAIDGTNVVTILADNANNSISVFTPISLGLLGLGLVIGIVTWLIRKGRKAG